MKRDNHLIANIADIDNLHLAFWKAKRGKEGKNEFADFMKTFDKNLLTMRDELLSGNVQVGDYHYFKIFDPKERSICTASFKERVLHHAIMNICHDNFERFQIFDSYASRKNKGTYAALNRAKYFQRKYKWFLKLDVRKYFDSVDHKVLKELLKNRFKDKVLLKILDRIIDSYQTERGKGLPIGNLTSQYFANHYLALADHYIKEKLQMPAYVRYMDDMVIWSNDKKMLLTIGCKFQSFLESDLNLNLKVFCLNSTEKGLIFLGYFLFPDSVLLTKNSRSRFKCKLIKYSKKLQNGEWTQTEYQSHVLPLIAFAKHGNTFNLRKKLINAKYMGDS